MIFGDEPKRVHIPTDTIRVRPLEPDEVRALEADHLVYINGRDFEPGILEPAHAKPSKAYLEGSNPTLPVLSIYGSQLHAPIDEVYVADENGEERPLMRIAGTRVSMTVFFTGVEDADEAVQRLKDALRKDPATIEVWNVRSGPVRDLRYDVYETQTAWVPKEGSRRGKSQEGSYEIVRKRLLARGVRDGHQHHFVGQQTPGWNLLTELHQPDVTETEVL